MLSFTYVGVTVMTLLCIASCQNSTSTSSAAYAISTDGNCGSTTNETCAGSTFGGCCSLHGFCGSTDSYCGSGCQDAFGAVGACQGVNSSISTTGSCGGSTSLICTGSRWGNCCSSHGYCGNSSTYCGVGCQASWGECSTDAQTNATATASASPSASSSPSASASSLASASSSASASPSAGPLFQQKMSVTQMTGFKAGISIMAVILALTLIGGIAFFLFRRRRAHTRAGHSLSTTSEGTATQSELDTDKPPLTLGYAGNGYVKPNLPLSELSAVASPQELPAMDNEKVRMVKVDERAAAGYDGAYRGN